MIGDQLTSLEAAPFTDAQRERKKLRVQEYMGRLWIGQRQISLTKCALRGKSGNEIWLRVDCERNPMMMFA